MTNPMYNYTVDSLGHVPHAGEVYDSPCGKAICRDVQRIGHHRYAVKCELIPMR